ncbi:MAG: hypothetical protein VB997_01055 [Opitutales bacterium]
MKIWLWSVSWFLGATFALAEVSILGEKPDWSRLDKYHESISRTEFEGLLTKVYVPRRAWWKDWLEISDKSVRVRKQAGKDEWYDLPFASCGKAAEANRPQEYWRSGDLLQANARGRPLEGFHIALDPGHIGGKYSEMEERHFVIGEASPVKEGNQALVVGTLLSKRLRVLGAQVSMVRSSSKPVTGQRPKTLRDEAKDWQGKIDGSNPPARTKKETRKLIRRRSEILFFRTSEIMSRARLVNVEIKPDFVVCIHLNAVAWPDPDNLSLVDQNHFHILAHGAYMGGEVALDNQRLEMLLKLLNRSHCEERSLAECMAVAFARGTGLPAFTYKGPNAVKIGDVPGVWGRNLMANRLYECPVVFLEPYVANSKEVFARIQAGNYEGVKKVSGKKRVSLVEEYVDAVVAGLVGHAASHAH